MEAFTWKRGVTSADAPHEPATVTAWVEEHGMVSLRITAQGQGSAFQITPAELASLVDTLQAAYTEATRTP